MNKNIYKPLEEMMTAIIYKNLINSESQSVRFIKILETEPAIIRRIAEFHKIMPEITHISEVLLDMKAQYALQNLILEVSSFVSVKQDSESFDVDLQVMKNHIVLLCQMIDSYNKKYDKLVSYLPLGATNSKRKNLAETLDLEVFENVVKDLFLLCGSEIVIEDSNEKDATDHELYREYISTVH